MMLFKQWMVLLAGFFLAGCVSQPPSDINNVCHMFQQYPKWYHASLDVQRRWHVPVAVQMAIIHQESKFEARAKPPRTKLLWVIPWKRPSTAYGYSQALNGTWAAYKRSNGGLLTSRNDFTDGVDFIGWYANQAYRQARIPRNDAYALYLAYHEGIGGYQRKTYLKKNWLIHVAHKVNTRAHLYQSQLLSCRRSHAAEPWSQLFIKY
jgi:hypothetical protein